MFHSFGQFSTLDHFTLTCEVWPHSIYLTFPWDSRGDFQRKESEVAWHRFQKVCATSESTELDSTKESQHIVIIRWCSTLWKVTEYSIQYRHSLCLAVQQTGLGPYIALIFVKDSSVVIINSLKITVMNTEFLQLVLYSQNYLNYTECLKWPFGR